MPADPTLDASATEERSQPADDPGPEQPRRHRLHRVRKPARDLGTLLNRIRQAADRDRFDMVAAAIAFYAFLALFPAIAALISIWGLLADPAHVSAQVTSLGNTVPDEARALIIAATERIAGQSSTSLTWGMGLSLLLALWSSNRGMKAMLKGLAVVYDDRKDRSFIRETLLSLAYTVCVILLILVALGSVLIIPVVFHLVGIDPESELWLRVVRWPILGGIFMLVINFVYWRGPKRVPEWHWITPGALVAGTVFMIASLLFSYYIENFGSYNETYGSVAAAAIVLFWFFIGAFIVLLGARINYETGY